MQRRKPVRHHKSAAQRAQILAAFEQSGLSKWVFAQQQGIAYATLQSWLNKRKTDEETNKAGLVEVPNLLGSLPTASLYRLVFPRGLVLEIAPGFHPEQVRLLAEQLQSL